MGTEIDNNHTIKQIKDINNFEKLVHNYPHDNEQYFQNKNKYLTEKQNIKSLNNI